MWVLLAVLWLMPLSSAGAEEVCRVHQWPDGAVSVTCPASTPPDKAGLPFVDVPKATVQAMDRAKRYAWRLKNGKLVVDATVPAPSPTQAQVAKEKCQAIQSDPTVPTSIKDFCTALTQ